jgi:hypothetical protein
VANYLIQVAKQVQEVLELDLIYLVMLPQEVFYKKDGLGMVLQKDFFKDYEI